MPWKVWAALIVVGCMFSLIALAQSNPEPVVVSDGWPIRTFTLNNLGTVVFAGGQNPFSSDGLVLVNDSAFVKFAKIGDPAPGFPNKVFIGFLSNSGPENLLALNNRDDVAFSAAVMTCPDVSDIYKCFGAGEQFVYGLYIYSRGQITKVIGTGDQAPQTGGRTFYSIQQLWLNNRGDILFNAWLEPTQTDPSEPALFLYSAGRVQKVLQHNGPTPLGPLRLNTNLRIVFNDDGEIVFIAGGVFHFADGNFTKDVAMGDPAPDGGTFTSIFDIAANGRGDVVFRARFGSTPNAQGLFLRRRSGETIRILADGDPTPVGGVFSLWSVANTRGGTIIEDVPVSPRVNNLGDVVFAAPVNGGNASGALFLYTSAGLAKIAANGDAAPPSTTGSLVLFNTASKPGTPIDLLYTINDVGTVAFTAGLSDGSRGLFQFATGTIDKLAQSGDVAPMADGGSFAKNPSRVVQNDNGVVAFGSAVCCSRFSIGIFLSSPDHARVFNRDFEVPGVLSLPANWSTAWSDFGSGDAFRYDDDGAGATSGSSVLRLHVGPGGGSTFVLSDPIPVTAVASYFISNWIRYNLESRSDAVAFSVIQFDTSGNEVGFNEVRGAAGENFWRWEPRRLLIQTTPVTSSIRIRFGLMSTRETYLDVDNLNFSP